MLYDFIMIDKKIKKPLYRQIYVSIKNSIENGILKIDTKLPSIRRLSDDLNISKTTVTAAYDQLCAEGYIKNKPQSGYYVAAQFDSLPKQSGLESSKGLQTAKYYEYDFSSKSIDDKVINLSEWKKCVKDIINKKYLLTSYGEQQGEVSLRNALQKYSLGTRSVSTSADNIVVGAGTQVLLFLLCSLLGQNKKVAIADSSYVQSEFVFKSFGYSIEYFKNDNDGVIIDYLEKTKPQIVLINPNSINENGELMPVTRRLELINWAKKNSAFIVEDDYNGELRYTTHPMACIQSFSSENTIYLGSFSKVLLPSVRISYMVLPDTLNKKYNKIKALTNQTASKVEQTALAQYINSGKIDVHLRKARRIYLEKSKIIISNAKEIFGEDIFLSLNETSLFITIKLKKAINKELFEQELNRSSIRLMNTNDKQKLCLSFSGISDNKIKDGLLLLKNIISNI